MAASKASSLAACSPGALLSRTGAPARSQRRQGQRGRPGVRGPGDQEPQAVQGTAVSVDTSGGREHLGFRSATDAAQVTAQAQIGSRSAWRPGGDPRQRCEPGLEHGGRAEEHGQVHVVNALGIGVPAPVGLAGAVLVAASPFRSVPVRLVSPGHRDDLSWAKLVRT